jgi:hypothetical protein
MVRYKNKIINNWKEFVFEKFGDNNIFLIEKKLHTNPHIDEYQVSIKDKSNETKIIFQLNNWNSAKWRIYNVFFSNPNSPKLTDSNRSEKNRDFDGEDSIFNQHNLIEIEDWIKIPLYYGWKERTTFYNEVEIKTDCFWIQDGNIEEIPIKQNYLNNYGCMLFPFIPIKIWLTNRKLKRNSDKVRIEQHIIQPMLPNENHCR